MTNDNYDKNLEGILEAIPQCIERFLDYVRRNMSKTKKYNK